jgi:transcriptional regulator with XRE-family HTH domain
MDLLGTLKSRQIKAARALLDWSQEDLAEHSQLSVNTIRKLELGHISPRGKTTSALRHAFEGVGLEFVEPDGVRHRPEDITVYQGRDGYVEFFDDVHKTAKHKGGEIVFCCDSEIALGYLGLTEYQRNYAERMKALKGIASVRCVLTENQTPLWASDYIEYRYLSKHYVNSVPFYIYDNKYAALIYEADPSPKIIAVYSSAMSQAFRLQFQSMWDKATPLNELVKEQKILKKKTGES